MEMAARHLDRARLEIGWPPIYLKDHLAFKEFEGLLDRMGVKGHDRPRREVEAHHDRSPCCRRRRLEKGDGFARVLVRDCVAFSERLRREGYRQVVDVLSRKKALRPGLNGDDATSVLMVLVGADVYRSMLGDNEWPEAKWRSWVIQTLSEALSGPDLRTGLTAGHGAPSTPAALCWPQHMTPIAALVDAISGGVISKALSAIYRPGTCSRISRSSEAGAKRQVRRASTKGSQIRVLIRLKHDKSVPRYAPEPNLI